MAHMTRRRMLAAGATVLGGVTPRKPARADDAGPQVGMLPFSDIKRSTPPGTLPAVSFKTLDGSQTTLASFAGKKLVLNFWATWCVPCVAELPELDRLAATDSDIVVLAVSADRGGANVVAPFIAAHKIAHLRILLDPGSDAVHTLGVAGFPTTLLIDAAGKLRGTLEGPAAWSTGAGAVAEVMR